MKALMAAALLVATGAATALAAPPANDDFDAATEIGGLPFSDVVDTREATTADDDPDCIGQGPTVWYAFTPLEDTRVEANTFGSNYDTTLSVYTGTRGALERLACNDDTGGLQSRVRFDAMAGEAYFFMVAAFGSGPGGRLLFSVDVAPPVGPPLVIDLSIDRSGRFVQRTGEAAVSGILTCDQPASAQLFGTLRQQVGRRFIVQGFFSSSFFCDGETAWTAPVTSDTGRFAGGPAKAEASVFASTPDSDDFAEDDALATIRLRGGQK